MILAIDIGNSNVVFGLSYHNEWVRIWRIETNREKSVHYYQMQLSSLFLEEDIDPTQIDKIVLSSVVPDLTNKFLDFLQPINASKFILLNHLVYQQLKVSTSNPYELGTDLMANAVAANHLFRSNTIIVDFGTALTFTLVRDDGSIEGVNILPGIKTAIRSLSLNTAQLQEVILEYPLQILGKNTVEAIQNGVLIGYTGLVKYMIESIEKHYGIQCKTIATGGLAGILTQLKFDLIDKNLTLNGLRWVAENVQNPI